MKTAKKRKLAYSSIRKRMACVLLFLSALFLFPYAVAENSLLSMQVKEIAESGDIILDGTAEILAAHGIEPGDVVEIKSNEQTETASYYAGRRMGRYEPAGTLMLIASDDPQRLCLRVKEGHCDQILKITAGNEITISLKEKGGKLALQLFNDMRMMPDRGQFSSDESYCNFREVIPGKLYRSADPLVADERALLLDGMMRRYGIKAVMNMMCSEADTERKVNEPGMESRYYTELYEKGKVFSKELSWSYFSETFAKDLIRGFTFLAEHDPPYLLHCSVGRDRTGFSCMLLEMLTGADEDQVIADYMRTYEELYGFRKETEVWDLVMEKLFHPMYDQLKENYGYGNVSPAEDYLMQNGMESDMIQLLIRKLTN